VLYENMRGILEDARDLLGVLFEHGLASATYMSSKELDEIQRLFANAGLAHGSQRLAALAGALAANRLNATGSYERSTALITELWQYTSACLYRLDFAQVQGDYAAGNHAAPVK